MGPSTKSDAAAVPRAMGAVAASSQRLTQRRADDQSQRTHLGTIRDLDDFRSVTHVVISIVYVKIIYVPKKLELFHLD